MEYGGLAQLGERLPCKQEVSGSIPLISTRKKGTQSVLGTVWEEEKAFSLSGASATMGEAEIVQTILTRANSSAG